MALTATREGSQLLVGWLLEHLPSCLLAFPLQAEVFDEVWPLIRWAEQAAGGLATGLEWGLLGRAVQCITMRSQTVQPSVEGRPL